MKWRDLALVLLVAALAAGAAGCRRKAQAAPPTLTPPAATEARPETGEEVPPPDIKPEPPAESRPVVPEPRPRLDPPRPAPRPPQPEPEPTPTVAPPRISPRLSAAEQTELERRTNQAIEIAERNLVTANNRQLNTAQRDMAQKIRGFLGQARDAIRAGDWVGASNLADKARVLSIELVNSL